MNILHTFKILYYQWCRYFIKVQYSRSNFILFQLGLKDAQTVLTNAITEEATTATIYHAVAALANLGLKSKKSIYFQSV